ncbi:MAG: hypothetical protein HY290_17860 [Planctomycetia bacterium]|nr:hypothetical protein [Planctomycetia bacterium]
MSATESSKKQSDCPHCKSGPETYRYLKKHYLFDVDLAREIVSDGREPEEIDDDSIRLALESTRIHDDHLLHVNVRYPGIIAHVFFPMPDGTAAHGHALIDGNHRAARCLQLGRPFFAYILTEDESRQILLRSPEASPRSPHGCPSETESATV